MITLVLSKNNLLRLVMLTIFMIAVGSLRSLHPTEKGCYFVCKDGRERSPNDPLFAAIKEKRCLAASIDMCAAAGGLEAARFNGKKLCCDLKQATYTTVSIQKYLTLQTNESPTILGYKIGDAIQHVETRMPLEQGKSGESTIYRPANPLRDGKNEVSPSFVAGKDGKITAIAVSYWCPEAKCTREFAQITDYVGRFTGKMPGVLPDQDNTHNRLVWQVAPGIVLWAYRITLDGESQLTVRLMEFKDSTE